MNSIADVRAQLDSAPMSRAQIVAVALTFVLSALDGYDVLSVTFAAPAITAAWGIGKAALGVVLSAGLIGMALGAIVLAPLADLYGRKTLVLVSLALMAPGMALCANAHSIGELALWRVVTGLGIGCCVAVINPIAAEFANARRRAFTVAIMAIGYPVGGVAGGLIAAVLMHHYGWPAVFMAGAMAAAVLLPIVALFLPESPGWLLSRRDAGALARVNAVLQRLGHGPLAMLPPHTTQARRGYALLFAADRLGTTAWITSVNVLFVLTVYYVLSWLPQMVADAGFAASSASVVAAVANLAGVASGLALGWLAQRGGLRWLTAGSISGLGIAAILFGLTPASLPLLMLSGGICGFFLFGGATGLYATLATTFGDADRASGTGFVSGIGRVSSAIAPLIAGWLFATGFDRAQVSTAFGACSLAAGALLYFGWQRFRSP
ncbi:MAG TPA: MFS transporter [Povalibacter sp.]|uniref:MFS transporter n=1 Tax=Povalibacter sp. TaxID=1962978 RepID=UPI002C0DF58D|nr:MFS transporter [Povalibacter sp.]HMN43021.1 MFS transporter [Povalibacter sp.]